MSTWARAIGGFVAALLLLFTTPAFAQSFPAFTGLVTDAANVLPADRKAALETKLEAFQKQTGRQLVVATIPDLEGHDIADYGYRLGRTWGVGLKGADNGAILVVAPKDRKVRIEVGRRLEPVLTDAYSGLIIQQKILPAFKVGDLPGGVEAGADALIQHLSLPDDQARAETAKAAAEYDKTHKRGASSGGIPVGLIVWLAIAGFILLGFMRRRGARWHGQSYGGGGSNWPIWLWAASDILNSSGHSGGSAWGSSDSSSSSGGSDGSWGGGGFTGGGGGGFGGGGASGSW